MDPHDLSLIGLQQRIKRSEKCKLFSINNDPRPSREGNIVDMVLYMELISRKMLHTHFKKQAKEEQMAIFEVTL
ncbi:hypothetical protein L2E82_25125 [Cichorium intybus]|uniref:Uncharacterized protein n=1 Tax=Cichorium intybus TaxID=13427 RepID=A0ACB9E307_CICIN|nr:hypothetical protein L2E82_25125 [Cichorium intybus]